MLVTGAQGFVGQRLLTKAVGSFELSASSRSMPKENPWGASWFVTGEFGPDTDWSRAVEGVDIVMHVAARAHITNDVAKDPLAEYRRVNVEGTRRLIQALDSVKLKRLVYVSSVKAQGESSSNAKDGVFRPTDTPAPEDAYGISKLETETLLQDWSKSSGTELVIVRPVMVYGPYVRGNFLTLMRLILTRKPLPLGAVKNRRSIVAIDNLVDLLLTVAIHPNAAGNIFYAKDAKDLTTTELIQDIATALNVKPFLLAVPPSLMIGAGTLLGKQDKLRRLFGDLAVDTSNAESLLGWTPKTSRADALKETADWFKQVANKNP